MDEIIKLDLIKFKRNNVKIEDLEKNNNLFLSLGKYDYFQIKKYEYEGWFSILHLDNLNENNFEDSNCSSYYLCDAIIPEIEIEELINKHYCFLSFLDGPNLTQEIINRLKQFQNSDIDFQLYKVLNGFTYILIASSEKYLPFASLILKIRKIMVKESNKPVFNNSYSIVGLNTLSEFSDEKIPKITIHAKLNNIIDRGKIAKEIEKINLNSDNSIEKYDHIGTSDCFFSFKDIDINKFLEIYKNFFIKNLNDNDSYFAFLDTKFSNIMSVDDCIDIINIEDVNIKKYENLERKKNALLKEVNNNKMKIEYYGKIYFYNILNVIDAVSKVDKTTRYEVAYEMILDAFFKFIRILSSYNLSELNNIITEKDFCLVCNAANRILETINYSRNNLSLEQLNVNESVYNFPHRFLDFYNRFIEAILLSFQDKSVYKYLITPCLIEGIEIIQVFRDSFPDDKILIINVPVNLLYKPELLCPMLVHDIGHYCGQEIRKRESRKDKIIKGIYTIYLLRLFNRAEISEILKDEVIELLLADFASYIKDEYVEFSKNYNFTNHRDLLEPFLVGKVRDYVINNQNKISNMIMKNLIEAKMSIGEIKQKLNIIQNNLNNMVVFEKEDDLYFTDIRNMKANINELFELYNEGFADCFAMEVLNIDIDDLKKCFQIKGSGRYIEKIDDADYDLSDIRILIQNSKNKTETYLESEELENLQEKKDTKTLETPSNETEEFLFDKKMYEIIRIPDILADCQEYINECRDAIKLEIEENEKSQNSVNINDVRKIFNEIKNGNKNISILIEKIDSFVDKMNILESTQSIEI